MLSVEPLEKEKSEKVLTPTKVPIKEVNQIYTFKNVLFDFDKAELLSASYKELNQLYEYLKEFPNFKIEIYGHTDNVGLEKRNKELSELRAKAVSDYLISLGLDSNRIKSFGFGSSKPITTNATPSGRQTNRRVAFKLIKN